LSDLIELTIDSPRQDEWKKMKDSADFFKDNKNFEKKSIFGKYFATQLLTWNKLLIENDMETGENIKENPFYEPKILDLLNKYFNILPLWSGIMNAGVRLIYQDIKLIMDNNPVEDYFAILKVHQMLNRF
jgi:hypothetical protein